MAYTDGLMVLSPVDAAGIPQVIQVETAAALINEFYIPCNITVLQFGVYIGEDFTEHTLNPVVTLSKLPTIGGTSTELVALTLATGTASTLKQGDGTKEAQTAMTADVDIDVGDTILAYPGSFPITIKQGEFLAMNVRTASGSSGGSVIPFAIVRIDGVVDGRASNVWTATTKTALV